MDSFYTAGVQAALEKLGGSLLGRLSPALRDAAAETTRMATHTLPSKAQSLKKVAPEILAKKKFLAGSTGPW